MIDYNDRDHLDEWMTPEEREIADLRADVKGWKNLCWIALCILAVSVAACLFVPRGIP